MRAVTRHVDGKVVLALDGDADLGAAPRLAQALGRAHSEAVTAQARLVVDLDGLWSVDDSALGLLVGASAAARRAGIEFAVVCSADRVRARLADTRLDTIFEVLDRAV